MKLQGTDPGLRAHFERAAATALDEDLGGAGPEADVTTVGAVPENLWAAGEVLAKSRGVVCGLAALEAIFGLLDQRVFVRPGATDGDEVTAGEVVAEVEGPARILLTGERGALNVISHLSGIATLTRRFVDLAPGVELTETRKTLPGLRALEKYAVRVGGGTNHRVALWDAVLVKDNHIAAAGGIPQAVRGLRATTTLPVEVECSTPDEVEEALAEAVEAILLDNHDTAALRAAVERIRAAAPATSIEASGGVTLDTVAAVAATGVDRVSVGALTHSAPALDFSFELVGTWTPEEP